MLIKNKKGIELALQSVVILIIMIVVLVVIIYFFANRYGDGTGLITNISDNAIGSVLD